MTGQFIPVWKNFDVGGNGLIDECGYIDAVVETNSLQNFPLGFGQLDCDTDGFGFIFWGIVISLDIVCDDFCYRAMEIERLLHNGLPHKVNGSPIQSSVSDIRNNPGYFSRYDGVCLLCQSVVIWVSV